MEPIRFLMIWFAAILLLSLCSYWGGKTNERPDNRRSRGR